MGLKRSSKVSAEFNMSSLTDIIFLLLIFFMLTSNLVQIKPFDLPKSDSTTVAPVNIIVQMEKDGTVNVNGETTTTADATSNALLAAIDASTDEEQTTVTIVAETGVPFSTITPIMKLAASRRARAIIATQPN